MTAIGRWHGLVVECPDPARLAGFYQALLGMIRVQDDGERAVVGLGARRLDDGQGGRSFRVFADPAGHPFCLIV